MFLVDGTSLLEVYELALSWVRTLAASARPGGGRRQHEITLSASRSCSPGLAARLDAENGRHEHIRPKAQFAASVRPDLADSRGYRRGVPNHD